MRVAELSSSCDALRFLRAGRSPSHYSLEADRQSQPVESAGERFVDGGRTGYQREMYKPGAKRRWGYFALPMLHRDRLVGKVDATADRKAGVLRVDAIHEDEPFNKTQPQLCAVS
jgi:hypothetical protein